MPDELWKCTWNNFLGFKHHSRHMLKTWIAGENCFRPALKLRSFFYLLPWHFRISAILWISLWDFGCHWAISLKCWALYFSRGFIKVILSRLAVAVELSDQRWTRENQVTCKITIKSIAVHELSYSCNCVFTFAHVNTSLRLFVCAWLSVSAKLRIN